MKKYILAVLILFFAPVVFAGQWRDPSDFLPPNGFQGWSIQGKNADYNPSNLYLYIDGQAEMYLDYGFKYVVSAVYSKEKESGTITVDIYDMGEKYHAYGIYSVERDPSAKKVKVGAAGYFGGNVFNFCEGRYYVKVLATGPISDTENTLTLFAKFVSDKIPGDDTVPEKVKKLELEDMVMGTVRLTHNNFMGYSFLRNTFNAQFKIGGGEEFMLFISEYDNPKEALAAYNKYMKSISKDNKKTFKNVKGFGDNAFYYMDKSGKEHIVLKDKNCVCGAVGKKLGTSEKSLLKKVIP